MGQFEFTYGQDISQLLIPPAMFRVQGEADVYLRLMTELISHVKGKSDNAIVEFAKTANVIPLYFNQANLNEVMSKRGDLIESALKLMGHQLDYVFPDRKPGPIKLGVITNIIGPTAETHAAFPFYEHLKETFPGKFEVTLYCLTQSHHQLEKYAISRVDHFKTLPPNVPAQVQVIRGDDLDILLFASNVGAVTNSLAILAAYRLARVQATSVFCVATSGFSRMDYYVSGTKTDPSPAAQDFYREKLVQMEGAVHCFSYPLNGPTSMSLSRAGLGVGDNTIVFASGANFHKCIPELLHTWARVMTHVKDSVLFLMPYGPNWSNQYPKAEFSALLASIFADYGISEDRIRILEQPVSREDLQEILRVADVYLDSFPFCGSTSLMEPLKLSIPVVTRRGEQLRSNMAAAILDDMGLTELIANDEDHYVRIASNLAIHPAYWADTRVRIKAAMEDAMVLDSEKFAQRIGPIYQKMAA